MSHASRHGNSNRKSVHFGHSRAGICRRPMLCNEVWMVIAQVCERANLHGRCAATFGKRSKACISNNILCTWKAIAIHSIHRLRESRKRYKAAARCQEDATRNADSDCDLEESDKKHSQGTRLWYTVPLRTQDYNDAC